MQRDPIDDELASSAGPGQIGPIRAAALALALACTAGCPASQNSRGPEPAAPSPPAAQAPAPAKMSASALPAIDRWLAHVNDELLPFWSVPDALGTPEGNFPTFRCNDGSAYRAQSPCPELDKPPGWIANELGTEHTRMKSRQTFTYGVAFHITGQERYLTYARAGVDWLRQNAYERATGSAISYWRDGQPGPPPAQRTAQDLAYAQLGLAFYYYLTRDPEVLGDLLRLERHVLSAYWEPSWGMLRWVREDSPAGDQPHSARQELVSQLDQINAYMLLLAPLMPEGAAAQAWRGDLLKLATVLKDRYFAPEHGLFWGTIHDPDAMKLGSRHTDFGHTVKALWMIYLVGQLYDQDELVRFARTHTAPLLQRAHQPSGCWASGLRPDGTVDGNSQWWVFAELDQTAATFALREENHQTYARYLDKSYQCWLTRFVDHENKGIWPFVPANWTEKTFAEWQPLKVFHWKSGYHEMEHALVALITTAGLTGRELPLYYAFKKPPPEAKIQPYLFGGTITSQQTLSLPGHPDLAGAQVVFDSIR